MSIPHLKDRDVNTLINALKVAVMEYERLEERFTRINPRLAEQFNRQVTEAKALVEQLEES
jgi:hypothetical protein